MNFKQSAKDHKSRGIFYNFLSAICFYSATFFVHKGIYTNQLDFPPILYIFFRQILGLLVFAPFFIQYTKKKGSLDKANLWIWMRYVFNLGALFCFYVSIAQGGAGRSNVLNMTYPIFVLFSAILLLKEKMSNQQFFTACLSFFGIILFLWEISFTQNLSANLWALASAIFAGISITILRGATQKTETVVILFWIFLFGSITSFIFCYETLLKVSWQNSSTLLLSGLSGVFGQLFLTLSYKHINAITGSLISTIRIPLALLMGLVFLGESFIWNEYIGSSLILFANVLLALYASIRKSNKRA